MADFLARKTRPAWSSFMMRIGETDYRIVRSLDDERLRLFGLRLLYFEARSVLPEALKLELERALSGRLVDDDAGGLLLTGPARDRRNAERCRIRCGRTSSGLPNLPAQANHARD